MMHPNEALFANDAFYVAFNAKDENAMAELWAKNSPVICLHPGWPPLTNRGAIIESWRRIFSNPGQPELEMASPNAYTMAGGVAVLCYERIGPQVLIATNWFIAENGVARIAHHQSGPCAQPPPTSNPRERGFDA